MIRHLKYWASHILGIHILGNQSYIGQLMWGNFNLLNNTWGEATLGINEQDIAIGQPGAIDSARHWVTHLGQHKICESIIGQHVEQNIGQHFATPLGQYGVTNHWSAWDISGQYIGQYSGRYWVSLGIIFSLSIFWFISWTVLSAKWKTEQLHHHH